MLGLGLGRQIEEPAVSSVIDIVTGLNNAWELNDLATGLKDLGPGELDFTAFGTPTPTTVDGRDMLNFNNVADYLQTDPVAGQGYHQAYTWTFFFTCETALSGSQNAIVDHRGSTHLYYNFRVDIDSGKFEARVFDQTNRESRVVVGTTDIQLGTLYFAAVTNHVTEGLKVYINGVREGNIDTTALTAEGTVPEPIRVGNLAISLNSGNRHNGRVGLMFGYNVVLNEQQIQALYNN